MTQTNNGFGKPRYGGNGGFSKSWALKEGPPMKFRFMPPMKSLADQGIWKVFAGTHFGYKGNNPKDPNKPFVKTFKCVQEKDFRSGIITQDCPECDLIAERKADKEAQEAEYKAKGHTEDEVKELVAPLADWLKDHNCDRKWHINVKNVSTGEFGTLKLSHKTMKLVDKLIEKTASEESIDALDLDTGVVFVFTRTGKYLDAVDAVALDEEAVRDPSTGRISKTTKLAPLSEAECQQALKECPDLTTVVREIPYEKIKLLTQCSGDPEEVDEILAMGEKREASPRPLPARPAPKADPKPQVEPRQEQPKSNPAPVSEPQGPAEEDEEAVLAAKLAALKAKKEAAAKAAKPAPVSEPPAAQPESVPPKAAEAPSGKLPFDRKTFLDKFKKPGAAGEQPK